jgi:S1-C subfamily serine protease
MPLSSTDDVWHVLEVASNSPADKAGLLPYGDYIIGSPEGIVKGESGLPELVEHVSHSRTFENTQ